MKIRRSAMLMALALATMSGMAFADAVDNCSDAVQTPAGTYAFDLSTATNDGTGTCGLSAASADQWFKHTATVAGFLSVTTCGGTDVDTVLAIFDGCGGTQLACVDDDCGLQTTVSVVVSVGQTVYIRVAGYNGEVGSGTLTITPPAPPLPGTVSELLDAGDLVNTAMVPSGNGPISSIVGNITSGEDADLYRITIAQPASFLASTDNAGPAGDTQLWLFTTAGVGITQNDDKPGAAFGIRRSELTSVNTASLQAGEYVLGISLYNRDPVDASGGLLWNACDGGVFTCENGPTGPGAANSVASWINISGTSGYTITLTGVTFPGGTSNCVADRDDGTGTGTQDGAVNIDDLLFFLVQFEGGLLGADVDNGTATGTTDGAVNIDDLLYFLFRFEEGC